MKIYFLLLFTILQLSAFGQKDAFQLYHEYDSLFTAQCLDVFEDEKLIVLYDSLNETSLNAQLAALDTMEGISDEVKKSYEMNIKSHHKDQIYSLAALANSNGISIEEQKMIHAQEKCIAQFEPITPAYSFTFNPNESVDFEEIYADLNENSDVYIQPFDPVWVDVTFGDNHETSLSFRAEWNEENTDIVTISPPEGCQICDFSFSDSGSRGNYRIEEGKSFVFEDAENGQRVIKLILDISSTGSFEFYDRWSSNAKLSDVKLRIIPYYYDSEMRKKYNCYTPKRQRVIKNSTEYHQNQMKYDPKNMNTEKVILKD